MKSFQKISKILIAAFVCLLFSKSILAQNPTLTAAERKEMLKLAQEKRDSTTKAREKARVLLAKERQRISDSTTKARTKRQDSIAKSRKQIQKQREKLAKYKSSRKFTDSVDKIRKNTSDSITLARKLKVEESRKEREEKNKSLQEQRATKAENLAAERERIRDSVTDARKQLSEKLAEQRKKRTDSLTAMRKTKADSLAEKRKKIMEKIAAGYKSQDQKMMEEGLKAHKAKQEKYSNQNFLRKPWTMNRRIYQNTVTRYNYYYNARNRYNTTMAEVAKGGTTNWDSLIAIESAASKDAGGGNMDSVIRKANMSIQIHDPRSKWFDNLYYLMGKAYFAKGDYENALTTFQYIASEYKDKPTPSKNTKYKKITDSVVIPANLKASIENRKGFHRLNHHSVRNDALLWMVRAYLELEATNDAQLLLSYLESDKNFPKRLKGDLNMLASELHLANENNEQAIAAIEEALKKGSYKKEKKQRIYFLLGQLYQRQNDPIKSSKQFEKVLALTPDVEMNFYTKLNLAKNAAKADIKDIAKVEDMFVKIINDGKFEPYLDKAYLTLGQLQALSDPAKAIKTFQKAIKEAKGDGTKAEAFLAISNIRFAQKEYVTAKVDYDSTLSFLSNTHPNYYEADTRRSLLQDLVKELRVIAVNDSLLALAELSEKEQIKIAKKAIKQRNKLKLDEQLAANPTTTNSGAVDKGSAVQDKNWYFNNTSTMASGKDKFIQKWGTRPNVDNWRRLAAANEAQDMIAIEDSTAVNSEEEVLLKADLETYLAAIPKTEQQKNTCKQAMEISYYNTAAVYYAGLSDYPKSLNYLDTLLTKFPNTSFKEQAYYTQYMAHNKLNHRMDAAQVLEKLAEINPKSSFIKLAKDTNFVNKIMSDQQSAVAYYDATYELFKSNKFDEVLPRVANAKDIYNDHKLIPKFELLNAMALASLQKISDAKTILNGVIENYTGKEEATFAQDLLMYLSKSDTNATNDSTIDLSNLKPSYEQQKNGEYTYNANEPHYFIFILNTIDDKLYPTRSAFNDYNAIKHSADNLESTLSLISAKSGVLVFKSFVNAPRAKQYLKEVRDQKLLYANFKNNEYDMAIISEANFALFQQTRNLEAYLKFYKKNYK